MLLLFHRPLHWRRWALLEGDEMIRVIQGLVCLGLWVSAAASVADSGFYAGAAYGLAEVDGTASGGGGAAIGFLDEIESLPIDGLPFDDDDGAFGAHLGYDINRYVGIELGYTDLGQFVSGRLASASEPPQIDIESFSLLARLHYPLTDTISATWHLGFTESSFDVEGTVRFGGLFPNPQVREVPFTPVDDETGYRWGFGADWRFTPHVSVGLEFSRYDVKVLELDAYGVRLTGHL
jgi:opacity protein-like surface antigen